MFKRILVAIDGSCYSKKALEFACDLVNQYSAYMTILHVAYNPAQSHTMVLGNAATTYQGNQKELEEMAEIIVDAARDLALEADCEEVVTRIRKGSPAEQILEYSRENNNDLIILGSRGLSDVAGLLLGSVSHKVNHLCDCSCITVR